MTINKITCWPVDDVMSHSVDGITLHIFLFCWRFGKGKWVITGGGSWEGERQICFSWTLALLWKCKSQFAWGTFTPSTVPTFQFLGKNSVMNFLVETHLQVHCSQLMSGQHSFVYFSFCHKMHLSDTAEVHYNHAFMSMHIYGLIIEGTCYSVVHCLFVICEVVLYTRIHSMNLHCYWGVSFFLKVSLQWSWFPAAVVVYCSISQLISMCENTEEGSGLLMCDMCLMHLSPCSQLGAAYISATTGAVVTALGLKSLATVIPVVQVNKQKQSNSDTEILIYICICWQWSDCVSDFAPSFQRLPPIVSRFVPFAAVAAANCINIPFMRQR